MQPYVIRRGDFLALLAYKFGFDADTVWNDPANADLRKLRPDPNLLAPTDLLYIPVPPDKPVTHTLTTGQTNTFAVDVPTLTVTTTFADARCASQPYTVAELPALVGQSSDASGTITFNAPVDIGSFTVDFTDAGLSFTCGVGQLDPIDTLSGVVQRLQNLGYLDPSAATDSFPDIGAIRSALLRFKAAQTGASDTPPPSSSHGSDDATPSSAGSSNDGSGGPPSSLDAGLSDTGVLDDETSKLLLSAYGF